MQWLNEPPVWNARGATIEVRSAPKTDFWRKTWAGFIADNGHFYFKAVRGDFVAQVRVSGDYADLYDQAGLMIRIDEANWMKCGVEFLNGLQHLSVVVTRDYSDWSFFPLSNPPGALSLRVTRKRETVEVHYSLDGESFSLSRQAYLPVTDRVDVGVMCAAPTGNGFAATFEGFSVSQG